MSALEAFPGHLPGKSRDFSDDLLHPDDRFTDEERARPRLSWLRQGPESAEDADRDAGQAGRSHRRPPRRTAVWHGRGHAPKPAPGRLHVAAQAAHDYGATLQGLTVGVVSQYVSTNPLPPVELPALILQVHSVLADLSSPAETRDDAPRMPATPVEIRRSVTPDALISFIDGKPYKTLKRHLATHGLDIEGYRRRYGLPADYPTVAANYAAARAALAKAIGLGRTQGNDGTNAPVPELFPRSSRRRKPRAA